MHLTTVVLTVAGLGLASIQNKPHPQHLSHEAYRGKHPPPENPGYTTEHVLCSTDPAPELNEATFLTLFLAPWEA